MNIGENTFIHKTSVISSSTLIGNFCVIEEGVKIGENCVVGNFSHIKRNTVIEDSVELKNHVFLDENVTIGNNSTIDSFTIIKSNVSLSNNITIGSNTILHKDSSYCSGNEIGSYCELGNGLKVGKNNIIQGRIRTGDFCTIQDNVTIKYGTILTSNVLLEENCFLGPNVITLGSTHKRVTVNGTIIGKNTYIGAGCKIAGGIIISENITTGALSFVNKDLKESGVYVGVPCKKIK